MKIEKFDSNSVNQILDPLLLQALVPIAEKYGLKVRSQAGRFTSYKWTAKFEFVAPEGAAENDSEMGRLFGAQFDVGFEFTAKGKAYRVTGFNPKRPKNDTEIKVKLIHVNSHQDMDRTDRTKFAIWFGNLCADGFACNKL